MSIVVSLISKKNGELKRFLDNHYYEDIQTDEDVMEWIYIYNKSADAINLINNFMDNNRGFDISLWVQLNDDDLVYVNEYNKNAIVQNINEVCIQKV